MFHGAMVNGNPWCTACAADERSAVLTSVLASECHKCGTSLIQIGVNTRGGKPIGRPPPTEG
jgi:hypothetical protein